MNKLLVILFAAITVAGAPAPPAPPAEAEKRFEAALFQENVKGDLRAAIAQYNKLVADFPANRVLAAKALLRIGECYEKLGMTESRKAYERVTREFSDQNEQAAIARGRLAKLGHATARAGVSARQVWTTQGLDLFGARIFPDGRRLARMNWGDDDALLVTDLVTGETKRLTPPAPGEGAIEVAISPDSRLIAYEWYSKKGQELRVMGADGSAPRSIYSNPETDVEPVAWFPDGKRLAVRLFQKDLTSQLAVISLSDGKARVLKSGPWRQTPGNMSVSPDGHSIVYDFPPSPETPERDIFMIAADGSRETVLVQHPAEDVLLGWTPDGKHILFRSNRSGAMSIWALPIFGYNPAGEPRQLKANVGAIQPLGFARDGAFYYIESGGEGREVHIADVDPETGRVVGSPKLASTRHVGEKGVAVYSPDGKVLVYQSGPRKEGGGARSARGITVRMLDTGQERDIATPMAYINAIFHNGEEIRVGGRHESGKSGLWGLDPGTGKFEPREPGLSTREGKQRFFRPQPDGVRTMERDLQTGRETVLVPETSGSFRNQAARSSPDWNWLVWRSWDSRAGVMRLMSARAGGGEPITLVSVNKPVEIITHVLTPDGKYVLFVRGANDTDEVWRVPIAGGKPQPTGIKAKSIRSISMHPDGRHVATGSFGDSQDSVWVMENYLSR